MRRARLASPKFWGNNPVEETHLHPSVIAQTTPDKPAIHHGRERRNPVTYRELDDRSNRFAQYLHAAGLRRGDTIALFMENTMRFLEVVWAAQPVPACI